MFFWSWLFGARCQECGKRVPRGHIRVIYVSSPGGGKRSWLTGETVPVSTTLRLCQSCDEERDRIRAEEWARRRPMEEQREREMNEKHLATEQETERARREAEQARRASMPAAMRTALEKADARSATLPFEANLGRLSLFAELPEFKAATAGRRDEQIVRIASLIARHVDRYPGDRTSQLLSCMTTSIARKALSADPYLHRPDGIVVCQALIMIATDRVAVEEILAARSDWWSDIDVIITMPDKPTVDEIYRIYTRLWSLVAPNTLDSPDPDQLWFEDVRKNCWRPLVRHFGLNFKLVHPSAIPRASVAEFDVEAFLHSLSEAGIERPSFGKSGGFFVEQPGSHDGLFGVYVHGHQSTASGHLVVYEQGGRGVWHTKQIRLKATGDRLLYDVAVVWSDDFGLVALLVDGAVCAAIEVQPGQSTYDSWLISVSDQTMDDKTMDHSSWLKRFSWVFSAGTL